MAEQAPPTTDPNKFLRLFYRMMGVVALVGTIALFPIRGREAALSYAFGSGLTLLPFVMWHLNIMFGIKPGQRPPWWIYPLIFLRYALLAGIFYAIIRLLQVQWPWFLTGTLTLVPVLIITTTLFRR